MCNSGQVQAVQLFKTKRNDKMLRISSSVEGFEEAQDFGFFCPHSLRMLFPISWEITTGLSSEIEVDRKGLFLKMPVQFSRF